MSICNKIHFYSEYILFIRRKIACRQYLLDNAMILRKDLWVGIRGPKLKLPLWRTFHYILHALYTEEQWKRRIQVSNATDFRVFSSPIPIFKMKYQVFFCPFLLVPAYRRSLPLFPTPGIEYGSIYICNPFDCPTYMNSSLR